MTSTPTMMTPPATTPSTNTPPPNTSQHWSQKKHESVLDVSQLSQLDLERLLLSRISGGSDNGQFVYLSPPPSVEKNPIGLKYLTQSRIIDGEIVLEVEETRISGFTLYDVIDLILKLYRTQKSIRFRSVIGQNSASPTSSAQLMPLDLRSYLDARFQKGSIDYDLQQIIRENVYMRTVPCTTRQARNGEINGQDYIFLSDEQFLELEQNGDLLEYGVYNGHYYGTPKPPKRPIQFVFQSSSSSATSPDNHAKLPSPKQPSTYIDQSDFGSTVNHQENHTNGTNGNLNGNGHHHVYQNANTLKQNNNNNSTTTNSNSSPSSTSNNTPVQPSPNNNITSTTTTTTVQQQVVANNTAKPNNSDIEIIPYGWEKVEDPEYGTFYIDHINKQTTYENPLMQQQQQQQQQSNTFTTTNSRPASSMKTFKPSTSTLNSLGAKYMNGNGNGNGDTTPTQLRQQTIKTTTTSSQNIYFTQNPDELRGEFIKTSLLKTAQGFGFTIIGANETSEDFLQIKYIVPDGAADRDGMLRQGDVLVYVNNECVLGYTHQDVVEIFQAIPVGQSVELTVCRGYPLSIDPNDPNIEIMSLAAINNPYLQNGHTNGTTTTSTNGVGAPLAAVDELTASTLINSSSNGAKHQPQPQTQQDPTNNANISSTGSNDEYYCEEYEEMYASIVKGPKGFGFTIADDSQMNHQKVKQILDKERCVLLRENDILLEINNTDLRQMSHNQVVELLKDCVKGQETIIKLKRRKYQIVLPQPPLGSSLLLNNSAIMSASSPGFNLPPNNGNVNTPSLHDSLNERRAKTPNILQSTSTQQQSNGMSTNGRGMIQNGTQNGAGYQLRSKTPTTDRMLFPNAPNDYLYLNGQNGQNKPADQLYSSVGNRSQVDSGNTMIISQRPQTAATQSHQHVPIYDSTTTIQHQRVAMPHKPAQHQPAMVNSNMMNRSKTPGPDMIYFRNDMAPYPNGTNGINGNGVSGMNGKSATISAAATSRSKTPTADIMYYPSATQRHPEFSGTQSVRQPMRSSNLFDAIYQPFNNDPYMTNQAYDPNIIMEAGIDIDDDSYLIPLIQQRQCTLTTDVDGNFYLEMSIDLLRQDTGFGFRIVGGEEEGSQVAVGYIVNGGAAHLDGRLRPNDEIIMIDEECVLGATHRRVVQLMTIAGLHRRVKLMVRRKLTIAQYKYLMGFQQSASMNNRPPSAHSRIAPNGVSPSGVYKQPPTTAATTQQPIYPYTITLFRNGNEGFGFVIISTVNKNGPTIGKMTSPPWIGKIVENSPAERCKRLNVNDRILAVNGINITQMNHIEIVKLIKESGNSITLTIGSPIKTDEQPYFSEGKAPLQNEFGNLNNKMPVNGADNKSRTYLTSPAPIISASNNTKALINQNDYHVIELRKPASGGFGFSIRGGKEFNIPLFVLKLADQGPAALDGRLQIGDQILEINGYDAYQMSHGEAIDRIKSGGNAVTLLIRRTGLPPPSITDIIAANSTTTTNTVQPPATIAPSVSINNLNDGVALNQHQSAAQLRSKSPYLPNQQQIIQSQLQQQQAPVKHFNSSGALINRNY